MIVVDENTSEDGFSKSLSEAEGDVYTNQHTTNRLRIQVSKCGGDVFLFILKPNPGHSLYIDWTFKFVVVDMGEKFF